MGRKPVLQKARKMMVNLSEVEREILCRLYRKGKKSKSEIMREALREKGERES